MFRVASTDKIISDYVRFSSDNSGVCHFKISDQQSLNPGLTMWHAVALLTAPLQLSKSDLVRFNLIIKRISEDIEKL